MADVDRMTDQWARGEKDAVADEVARWPRAKSLLLAARFQRQFGVEAVRELAELVDRLTDGADRGPR